MKFRKSLLITVLGGLIGVIGGYAYWYYVGCVSGTCPITSSPLNSSLYGALMGGLLFSNFNKKKKEDDISRDN